MQRCDARIIDAIDERRECTRHYEHTEKKLALRLRAALSCPGVRSESFGTPPAYRAYRPITSVTRDIRGLV